MLCIDFVSFLKDQILREFQNIEKFVIFQRKDDFIKEMHSFVSNIGFNYNLSQTAGYTVHFPQHLKKLEVPPLTIRSYPVSAHGQPRSQGLSSCCSLGVRGETLAGSGHFDN